MFQRVVIFVCQLSILNVINNSNSELAIFNMKLDPSIIETLKLDARFKVVN
jgi:hypothetical protein